jgi:hypothetical protein
VHRNTLTFRRVSLWGQRAMAIRSAPRGQRLLVMSFRYRKDMPPRLIQTTTEATDSQLQIGGVFGFWVIIISTLLESAKKLDTTTAGRQLLILLGEYLAMGLEFGQSGRQDAYTGTASAISSPCPEKVRLGNDAPTVTRPPSTELSAHKQACHKPHYTITRSRFLSLA